MNTKNDGQSVSFMGFDGPYFQKQAAKAWRADTPAPEVCPCDENPPCLGCRLEQAYEEEDKRNGRQQT